MQSLRYKGKHAVIIGGSISGMLAARVLANHFGKITILEKDDILTDPVSRKAVPQDRQAHIMNMKGETIISKYFPGFYEEIEQEIFRVGTEDLCFFHYGSWKCRCKTKVINHFISRPFFEYHLRRRLLLFSNIHFLQENEVYELITEQNKVLGVRLKNNLRHHIELRADLVIDASGRGTKTPHWLESLGYQRPREEKVEINIGYSSQMFPRTEKFDFSVMSIYPKAPIGTRMGVIYPIEGDRWLVGMVGLLGDYPSHDGEGFLQFAKSLDRPDIYDVIKNLEPLSPISTHRFPSNLWRHYEKMPTFPGNFIIVGDAMCSFNPIYAQGMCVAAMESEVLDQILNQNQSLEGLSLRYHKRASKVINKAWVAATSEDLRYPDAVGKRTFSLTMLNWYMAQIFELTSIDKKICSRFYEVQSFLKKPIMLFTPYIFLRVIQHGLGLNGTYNPVLERPKQVKKD